MLQKIFSYDILYHVCTMGKINNVCKILEMSGTRMKRWTRKIRPTTTKSIYFWNMAGSMCNAAKTVLLTMVCSWLVGDVRTGIFSLALATSQMLRPVGNFELRSAFVTDARHEFSFPSILGFSLFSNLAMMLAAVLLIVFRGYEGEKAAAILLMCLFILIQNISDAFAGQFQRGEHLELAGKSLFYSILVTSVLFGIVLAVTGQLIAAMAASVFAEALWLVFYDLPYGRFMGACSPGFDHDVLIRLFLLTLPLCLSSFLQSYIITASRYAIDTYLNDEMQAIYSYLFMPVSVINLFSIFFFRPILTAMAASWSAHRFDAFLRYVRRQLVLIAGVSVVVLAGGWLVGVQVLGLVYHADLTGYRGALMLALLGGVFSACNTFAYYILATFRCQRVMLLAYGFASLLMLCFSSASVRVWGLSGAFLIYCVIMALLTVVLYAIAAYVYWRTKRLEVSSQ